MDDNWENKTVVVVDDLELNYILIQKQLRKTKAKIIWLKNGQESVDYVIDNKPVDVILMDIRMPVLDGIEATRIIKGVNSKLPIIIQTAYVIGEEFDSILKSNCDDYFFKPIMAKDLYEKIRNQFT